MLNTFMNKQTKAEYQRFYETCDKPFRVWLDEYLNKIIEEHKRRIYEQHRFHLIIADTDQGRGITKESNTLIELLNGGDFFNEPNAVVFAPNLMDQDLVLKELINNDSETHGDATLIIVNQVGAVFLLRTKVNYNRIIFDGKPYQKGTDGKEE